MSDLQDLTNELMKDSEFKKEYEALQPERDITMSLIQARKKAGLTQEELSQKTGISQADISRLENGSRNPSLALLNRIAKALNASLRIEFIPNKGPVKTIK
ncbi:MAG: helix-turn-helix transcriptional regulator [Eubacterium sp.]|nr:helix-turn-helix transcriptional regulator [Eubacterium sp.]